VKPRLRNLRETFPLRCNVTQYPPVAVNSQFTLGSFVVLFEYQLQNLLHQWRYKRCQKRAITKVNDFFFHCLLPEINLSNVEPLAGVLKYLHCCSMLPHKRCMARHVGKHDCSKLSYL